jgi:hypothetical protein
MLMLWTVIKLKDQIYIYLVILDINIYTLKNKKNVIDLSLFHVLVCHSQLFGQLCSDLPLKDYYLQVYFENNWRYCFIKGTRDFSKWA